MIKNSHVCLEVLEGMTSYFVGRDLELIEALVYEPDLKPSYEALKDALIWNDERPDCLTPEGYEKLCDLWIVRKYIHLNESLSSSLDPKYIESTWTTAIAQGLKLPEFNRLELSEDDKKYYDEQRLSGGW